MSSKCCWFLLLFQSTCPRGARPAIVTVHIFELPFQSTCPRGARRCAACTIVVWLHFNPRAHEGHDPLQDGFRSEADDFNPRAHEGHDVPRLNQSIPIQFQSTCPRGARLGGVVDGRFCGLFQSTCPRGARLRHVIIIHAAPISIHVPTRGTTLLTHAGYEPRKFQSTCPRGARHDFLADICIECHFNPRAHEGHDDIETAPTSVDPISIHVPTRGTTETVFQEQVRTDFNPRAHEGHDVGVDFFNHSLAFQSTCPRGARLALPAITPPTIYFNPRAHEGHDVPYYGTIQVVLFQSTCPRGARLALPAITPPTIYFNPRAHEGHDVPYYGTIQVVLFQSTCPRGARHQEPQDSSNTDPFQSTCPRGARRLVRYLTAFLIPFQSTCPRGARQNDF